jgi:mannose-6-phosphate isomerase-like protein (cupin superfamily)
MKAFTTDIEKATEENLDFRRVLFTGSNMQLVVMSLKPGEEIGWEVHDSVDQFFRIEGGQAQFQLENGHFDLQEDEVIIVPAGTKHNVVNTSEAEELKLYTIYSPPNHPEGTVHRTKEDAERAEEAHR